METDYRDLIRDDAVHSRVFYDPAIFDEEMEKIFGRTWIYVGHESEVPEPGDYVGRFIGQQPVIMARGRDRKVRLFLNRCRHRSNTVCMNDRGRAANGFRCVYHGWTYATTGELVGVPYPEGFDPRDFRKADFPLLQVAMEEHRGFVFGNLNPSGGLEDFLGTPAARLVDQIADLAPEGEIEVRSLALKHLIRGNWKVAIDNTTDAYHVQILHRSALSVGGGRKYNWELIYGANGNARVRDLGNGHAQIDLSVSAKEGGGFLDGRFRFRDQSYQGGFSEEERQAHIAAIVRRMGEERAREVIAFGDPGPFTLFPTFSYVPSEIRILQPVSLFETHVYYYPVLLKGAADSVNAERLRRAGFTHGPAGMVTADDIDVFERSQLAFKARKDEWLYLRRGIRSERREEDGTRVGMAYEETSNRGIWQRYRELMAA